MLFSSVQSKSESVKIHTLSMRKSSHFKELIKFHTFRQFSQINTYKCEFLHSKC